VRGLQNQPDLDELLSANQAGKLLGVSGKTVIRMMDEGNFAGYKIGSYYKFKRGDILEYRDSRRIDKREGGQWPRLKRKQ
jgi:excisionase family DNA binding protein